MNFKKCIIILLGIALIVFSIILYFTLSKIQETDALVNQNSQKITKYNNPVIPKGFKTVNTENAKWIEENGKKRKKYYLKRCYNVLMNFLMIKLLINNFKGGFNVNRIRAPP